MIAMVDKATLFGHKSASLSAIGLKRNAIHAKHVEVIAMVDGGTQFGSKIGHKRCCMVVANTVAITASGSAGTLTIGIIVATTSDMGSCRYNKIGIATMVATMPKLT